MTGRPILLRCRGEHPADGALLHGDLPHWHQGIPLAPAGGGWLEAGLRLAAGTYEYKLRLPGGDWLLDAGNPRTRSRAGSRNSLLVVGGAAEPVLHAPAAPWLFAEDDGRLCVRAGLRRGAGDELAVRFAEGGAGDAAALARAPMRLIAVEDEHLLFEAHLPGTARSVDYWFELPGGRLCGSATGGFTAHRRELERDAPAWWRDAVVYSLVVDRFRPGGRGGAWVDGRRWDRDHRAGGDLGGVTEALPWLRDLGVDAIHLTPIWPAPSAHRYDVVDPRAVDPALGGEAGFDELLERARREGIRVLVDVTVTHVHRDFAPFADVRARGPASPWWGWFDVQRWPFADGPDPGYRHYQKGCWQEPLLRLDQAEVAAHVVDTFTHWARRGADGFRVDAAADVPVELCRRIRAAVRQVNPEAVVFGEVVPDSAERWTAVALDAATDFAERRRALDWLAGRSSAAELGAAAARARAARGPSWTAVGFAGCHDLARPGTLLGDPAAARLALLHLLCRAAVPLLYYGDEIGLASTEPEREFEDSWPDRQPMPWDPAAWDETTLDLVRRATALRRGLPALRRGDEQYLPVIDADSGAEAGDVLCLRRHAGDQIVDLLLHRGTSRRRVRLDGPAEPLLVLGDVLVQMPLAGLVQMADVPPSPPPAGLVQMADVPPSPPPEGGRAGWGVVELGPRSAIVLDRSDPPPADLADLREANAALAARAFADGMVDSPAYPVRIYLTVTEACNLRCLHCITDAPARTREGRARQVRPWLLAALAEPFAHADYVGFTHGGESLAAPGFFDVLAAIGRARAGRTGRADIHLASNGMLLCADTTRRLIDHGVTSLMVSLDGATAATNERIRAGARSERILGNLRDAVRARDAFGADLRIGLSMVVTRSNLGELEAMAALAVDLGVDWLKLEETWPAGEFARREQVPPRDPALAAGVAAAAARLAGRLTLVDHLDPPGACPCAGDPAAVAFRAADDFANRFRYRPCRAAWEQVSVDPDGTVHAVEHAGPVLGSLLDRPMAALWNGDAARRLRAGALAGLSPDLRRGCASHR